MGKGKDRAKAVADIAKGFAKRAAGEFGGRPDLVLDGERQEADGLTEISAKGESRPSGGSSS